MTKFKQLIFNIGLAIVAVGFVGSAAAATSAVKYRVTFVPTFTAAAFPYHFLLPGKQKEMTQLSPMIGGSYKEGHYIYKVGTKPTPEFELLAETGNISGLMKKMRADKGVLSIFSTSKPTDGGPVPPVINRTFEASPDFPLVGAVTMIGPSPDWIIGVSDVRLCDDNGCVASKVAEAYVYHAGGDAGLDYTSPDKDLNPKGDTVLASTQHFCKNKNPVVGKNGLVKNCEYNLAGVFVFTRIS